MNPSYGQMWCMALGGLPVWSGLIEPHTLIKDNNLTYQGVDMTTKPSKPLVAEWWWARIPTWVLK